jgi:putative ABC transport system permease protein
LFFTYLWRELRRRMRQAIFIAIGLALGIGLVITVTAASAGVKNAQTDVLHALYGVGTDITVTKAPTAGAGGNGFNFGFNHSNGFQNGQKSSTSININSLSSTGQLASISSSEVTSISKLSDVAATAGGLTLTDRAISGTASNTNGTGASSSGTGRRFTFTPGKSGNFGGSFGFGGFSVTGVDIADGELGPLSSQSVTSGRTFTTADDNSNVALLDADYATQEKLKVGDTVTIGSSSNTGTKFTIVGIVSSTGANPSDVYIPLERAQTLANLKNDVNTIYVAANNNNNVNSVASEISKTVSGSTVTTSADLASEITGSLSTTASLANNLGKWLAILVLVAAFLLASLLTLSAVTRRIREFGTLKALGWKSRRVVLQVMGESIAIGIIGGVVGVGLGFLGSTLVNKFAPALTADAGSATGSATPGGAQFFGGSGGFPGGGGGGGSTGGGFPTGGTGTGGTGTGGTNRFDFARSAANSAHTVTVHLSAPVTVDAIVAAVVLAILGGLIAGAFGGWRAASLRPAAALSKVG